MDDIQLDIYNKLEAIGSPQQSLYPYSPEHANKIVVHKEWLKSIRHERPDTDTTFKVGIYIRYFNQTKYDNYLAYHKKQFADTIALCPNWELVDFYIDEGPTAPNMESAPEWSRLLTDCMDGKIDLIITQKISNISKKINEAILCARILATQEHPIGIYFISEDIYTLASYYQSDMRDTFFLPNNETKLLTDGNDNTISGEDE
jgi:hypothetical protein